MSSGSSRVLSCVPGGSSMRKPPEPGQEAPKKFCERVQGARVGADSPVATSLSRSLINCRSLGRVLRRVWLNRVKSSLNETLPRFSLMKLKSRIQKDKLFSSNLTVFQNKDPSHYRNPKLSSIQQVKLTMTDIQGSRKVRPMAN